MIAKVGVLVVETAAGVNMIPVSVRISSVPDESAFIVIADAAKTVTSFIACGINLNV